MYTTREAIAKKMVLNALDCVRVGLGSIEDAKVLLHLKAERSKRAVEEQDREIGVYSKLRGFEGMVATLRKHRKEHVLEMNVFVTAVSVM